MNDDDEEAAAVDGNDIATLTYADQTTKYSFFVDTTILRPVEDSCMSVDE